MILRLHQLAQGGTMPASIRVMGSLNDILAGHGDVSLDVALAALAASPGLVMFAKKIGLWKRLAHVERTELIELDKAKPAGWWRYIQSHGPAAIFTGHRPVWRHGRRNGASSGFAAGMNEAGYFEVTTPVYDEGELR